jgi:hypothetical protein
MPQAVYGPTDTGAEGTRVRTQLNLRDIVPADGPSAANPR